MLVRRMTIGAYVGMPLGLLVYVSVDDNVLRFLLGLAVLVAAVMLALRVNLHHVGPRLDYGSGFISGVLATSLSTNGPPLVFVLQARQLSAVRFRATISTVFALSNVGGLALFIASGKITRDGLVAVLGHGPSAAVRSTARLSDSQTCAWRALPMAGVGAADRRRDQRHRERHRVMREPGVVIVAFIATAIAAMCQLVLPLEAQRPRRADLQTVDDSRCDRDRGRRPTVRDRRRLQLLSP